MNISKLNSPLSNGQLTNIPVSAQVGEALDLAMTPDEKIKRVLPKALSAMKPSEESDAVAEENGVKERLVAPSPTLAAAAAIAVNDQKTLEGLLSTDPALIGKAKLLHIAFRNKNNRAEKVNFLLSKGASLDEVDANFILPGWSSLEGSVGNWSLPDSYFGANKDERVKQLINTFYLHLEKRPGIEHSELKHFITHVDKDWVKANPNCSTLFFCEAIKKVYPAELVIDQIARHGLLTGPYLAQLLSTAIEYRRVNVFKSLLVYGGELDEHLIAAIDKRKDAQITQEWRVHAKKLSLHSNSPAIWQPTHAATPVPSLRVDFNSVLDFKNLAHLVGDSFVKEMKDDSDRPLEGSSKGDCIQFLYAGLNHISTLMDLGDISELKNRLEGAYDFAARINQIQGMDEAQIVKETLHLTQEILNQIANLPAGQEIMLPVGFPGHAVVLVCKKGENDQLDLQIQNTGDGLEYHAIANERHSHASTVNYYSLPIQELAQAHILQGIFEIVCVGPSFKSTNRPYTPEDLYALLSRYQVAETNEQKFLRGVRKPQWGGTCGLRSLLLYLKTHLDPATYKQFVCLFKEEAIYGALEKYKKKIPNSPR